MTERYVEFCCRRHLLQSRPHIFGVSGTLVIEDGTFGSGGHSDIVFQSRVAQVMMSVQGQLLCDIPEIAATGVGTTSTSWWVLMYCWYMIIALTDSQHMISHSLLFVKEISIEFISKVSEQCSCGLHNLRLGLSPPVTFHTISALIFITVTPFNCWLTMGNQSTKGHRRHGSTQSLNEITEPSVKPRRPVRKAFSFGDKSNRKWRKSGGQSRVSIEAADAPPDRSVRLRVNSDLDTLTIDYSYSSLLTAKSSNRQPTAMALPACKLLRLL